MKKILIIFLTVISFNVFAKEVKVIIPYSAGGPTDRVTRTILKYLNDSTYKFIPEYKLGAGGIVAANFVASSKDETILMVTSNALVTSPMLTDTSTYDLEKDFNLIEFLGIEPLFLVVKSNSEINSFKDFINASKKENMPYGSAGVGTSGHISSAIISQNNNNFIHVPYKGSAGIVIDLLNGQLKWILDSEINIGSFLKDGKLKPIAVYSNKRLSEYPQIPTIKELGIDDKNFYRWHILVSNKNADRGVLRYVQQKLNDPILKKELENIGLDLSDKPKVQNFFVIEHNKMKNIIKTIDIK